MCIVSTTGKCHVLTRRRIHMFSIDSQLVYWNFFLDFGPLNLGQLYRFCEKLNSKLQDSRLKSKAICFYSNFTGGEYMSFCSRNNTAAVDLLYNCPAKPFNIKNLADVVFFFHFTLLLRFSEACECSLSDMLLANSIPKSNSRGGVCICPKYFEMSERQ